MRKTFDIIFLDGFAGILSGLAVLSLSPLILKTHNWPTQFLIVHITASIVYGTFSLSLAYRQKRPEKMIAGLAIANGIWATVCAVVAMVLRTDLTMLGMSHLFLETILVGALGVYEWINRHNLVKRPP